MTETAEGRSGLSRRNLLKIGAVGTVGAVTVATLNPFEALTANARAGRSTRMAASPDYGPLSAVRDQATGLKLIALPKGFEYISYGWTGDEMSDGKPTPSAHDGMAAFAAGGGKVALVRNHERGGGKPFTEPAYDPAASGGTTNLRFDTDGRWLESYASLSGTIRNCAGGPTPWGSWITCEETTDVSADGTRHGYVFDVPADGKGDPEPLKDAGRFSHEAVAIDPRSGILYLTEDETPSGLYRYLAPGRESASGRDRTFAPGGELQMMKIGGNSYTTYEDDAGTRYKDISWVTIDNPDWAPGEQSTVDQGIAKGGAKFARLEGAWYGDGNIYIVSTSGGPAGEGQIFEYNPRADRMRVLYASPSAEVLNAPDNICFSPRGGLVLCEDGDGPSYVHGLTREGKVFPFAQNLVVIPAGGVEGKSVAPGDYSEKEWAGACFDESGKWLFVNIQSPGITFAITGPWRNGGL